MIMRVIMKIIRLCTIVIIVTMVQSAQVLASTVSVVIPCYYKHFKHVPELLASLCLQTALPNEVVISLSEADKLSQAVIASVEKTDYPFVLKIIKHSQQLYAGDNRQRGSEVATGDILIYQDSDDLPHVQRIELIKACFNAYDVMHVMHSFVLEENQRFLPTYDKNAIKVMFMDNWAQRKNLKKRKKHLTYGNLTHGNIAIRKDVLNQVSWGSEPRGQDTKFNEKVVNKYKRTAILKAELLIYRQNLSSLKS